MHYVVVVCVFLPIFIAILFLYSDFKSLFLINYLFCIYSYAIKCI